jgi:hypothetical protein
MGQGGKLDFTPSKPAKNRKNFSFPRLSAVDERADFW